MSSGMFVGMDNTITDGLHAVLQGQTSVYGNMINVITISSFTLFVTYRGYQTLAGKLHTPIEDVAWDVGRMLLIITFVLNLGGWLDLAISAINGLKDGVSGDDNVWVLLDTVWSKAQAIGQTLYQQDDSTYVKLNGGIAELLVWGGAIVTLLLGSAVNLLAEITIVLMITTAPLFIFCLLYGFLIPMFNSWLKVIFTVILTVMFSALSIRIVINYLNSILEKAVNFADNANIITLGVQCCVAGVISGIIIYFSAKVASALGGVAVQVALQGAAMNGLSGLAKKSSGTAKPTIAAGATAARQAAKGSVRTASATGQLIASGTDKAMAAWQKRAASIDSIKRFNQQRNR
ncbi:type IV secretion system protein [Citrobacter freundii]|uniref:type IV secretion system protein n=1 Tax=Citrobacter freundii TaxID=546 RepID=UPI000C807255|nr:type IV secretion system protein [Citrobacter freundii]EMB4337272.1 type IV secretion system protein [Citrobacter freundii]MBJ9041918.1 type IV secretion system protein [Citrobacter freundii]NTY76582.1 type IV secretion system protein [Citrobacter freundii]NUA13030.1 type IV secretion system protein [Citrobacter freundii]PMD03457.1 conjugal transfer protein TrbL [Citrobacter freundii]